LLQLAVDIPVTVKLAVELVGVIRTTVGFAFEPLFPELFEPVLLEPVLFEPVLLEPVLPPELLLPELLVEPAIVPFQLDG
jgi:hypothetical protein